ncbi:MAG: YciI family protein [Acidobacteriota bacterium]
MKYALMIHETPEELARREGDEAPAYWAAWSAFSRAIEEAGVGVGGAGLLPPSTATTVRLLADGKQVQDGPFADSKEQLGGFYLIDVPDLDSALEWASRIPAAGGAVEVRPLMASDDA